MNTHAVIDSYVADVVRRLPSRDRAEISLELRGLLGEMLDARASEAGRPADDAMVLQLLREFGAPTDVAARYRAPGTVIIPAEQTRSFVLVALIGVALQWALTLSEVFNGGSFAAWYLTNGLGALWWPGFMLIIAMIGAGLRRQGWFQRSWQPRIVDPDRVNRGLLGFGLFWYAFGVSMMVALPWIVDQLPGPVGRALAIDPQFLRYRAWPVLLLWLGGFVVSLQVLRAGRWSVNLRRLELAFTVGFIALMGWWIADGPIMQSAAADKTAKACLALVIVFLLIDIAAKLHRQRAHLKAPRIVG